MPTRQQERAEAAHHRLVGQGKDYGRVCADLPALIRQCGLCQAIAFLQAKAARKTHFRQVLEDLGAVAGLGGTVEQIGNTVRTAPVTEYQRLSREALFCAEWFSRYAEALLEVGKGEGERQ